MGGVIGLAFLAGIIFGVVRYRTWLKDGVKARVLTTTLAPEDLRATFERSVCTSGWRIVDDGNPCIAQSSLATGSRQQIGLELTAHADGTYEARIFPNRMQVKVWSRTPTKGHTIRMRMNRFVEYVRIADPAAVRGGVNPGAPVDFAGDAISPVRALAAVVPTGPSAATEGWYPDPLDGRCLRWWDGNAWTHHQQPR